MAEVQQVQGFEVGARVRDKRTQQKGQVLRIEHGVIYWVWFGFGDTRPCTAENLEAVTA